MTFSKNILATAVAAVLLTGCATDDPNRNSKIGAVIGAATGAVIGHNTDSKDGRIIGAAVGAIAGAAIGNYMDEQENKLENELKAERDANEIMLERLDDKTIRLRLNAEASFDVDSATLKPSFDKSLTRLSEVFNKYDKTIVHVVGYTDSTGSDSHNQELSEKRSASVVEYFKAKGINDVRLKKEGRGENEALASNDSAEGRAQNRRVELYVVAVEQGNESAAEDAPDFY